MNEQELKGHERDLSTAGRRVSHRKDKLAASVLVKSSNSKKYRAQRGRLRNDLSRKEAMLKEERRVPNAKAAWFKVKYG